MANPKPHTAMERIEALERKVEEIDPKLGEYGLFWSQPTIHPNPRRFYGAVCAKHPSLQGERRRLDGECIGCHDQQPPEKEAL